MSDRKPCVRCGRTIDGFARICPYCNWDQNAPVPANEPQQTVATDYRPPEETKLRKYVLGGIGGKRHSARFRPEEDYTNKYKGEQVEVALFGGEYQEGVLTAYCYVEDVAHIELNGHILVPLQNIASLHCSSRCDAPDDDWPPRGLEQEDGQ